MSTKMSSERSRLDEKDLRVLNRRMIYCIGVPCNLTDEQIESYAYFGQYGKIEKIVVMNGNKYQNTTSVYITFSNEVQAAMAIIATNAETVGRNTLKTIFGTVKYCHYFLKKIACKNLPDCPYLHVYDKKNEVYIRDTVFEVQKQHQNAARDILLKAPSNKLIWKSSNQDDSQPQRVLQEPQSVLRKLFPDNSAQVNSKIVKMLMKKCQTTFTSKHIKTKLAKQDKSTKNKLYESLCIQYPLEVMVRDSP